MLVKAVAQVSLFGGEIEEDRMGDSGRWYKKLEGGVVLVEDRRHFGKFFEVDLLHEKCSCGNRECGHLQVARDFLIKDRDPCYTVTSAMHKSVRKGDVTEVLSWARWFKHLKGAFSVKDYAKRILLEETRNVELLIEMQSLSGKDWEDLARRIGASRKKWEIECRRGSFEDYLEGYIRADNRREDLPSREEIERIVSTSEDPVLLYEMMWGAKLNYDDESRFKFLIGVLEPRVKALGGWPEKLANQGLKNFSPGIYVAKMSIEMLTGRWDDSGNEIYDGAKVEMKPESMPVIQAPRPYVFDNHTRTGRRLIIEHFNKIEPNKPLPDGIDLRWSGMLIGVGWRECAAKQFPRAFMDKKWEEVTITQELWDKIRPCDKHYYRRLFSEIEKKSAPACDGGTQYDY